jgi:hypothetical protein
VGLRTRNLPGLISAFGFADISDERHVGLASSRVAAIVALPTPIFAKPK